MRMLHAREGSLEVYTMSNYEMEKGHIEFIGITIKESAP